MAYPAENVFLVESPLQLLNAIEAKNHFGLSRCHLIVHIGGTGFSPDMLKRLAAEDGFDKVHHLIFFNDIIEFESSILGKSISSRVRGYCYDYQKHKNRKLLDDLTRYYRQVKNIFLGNYLRGHQDFMRHFANRVRHDNLFLLDDGTDAMLIAKERRKMPAVSGASESASAWLKAAVRSAFLGLNTKEADKVTFFSAYELETCGQDDLIRNDYGYLRDRAAGSALSNEVYFLGQCLVEDHSVDGAYYLECLSKVKAYFKNEDLVYIPHPRESQRMLDRIQALPGVSVRRFDVPIEFELSVRGGAPKVLAGFFTSALQNCLIILDSQVLIKAFYLPPERLKGYEELSLSVYDYFESIENSNFELVRL